MIGSSKPWVGVALLVASISLVGCEPYDTRPRYQDRPPPRYVQQDRYACQCGVVREIRQVNTGGGNGGTLGAVIGAVAGGVLGNTIGKGDGRKAATVVGAVAGGVAGNQIGKRSDGSDVAFQIGIQLDDGRYATVTQREDPGMRPGDYVEIRNDHVYPR
ncbi:glycine zipper 2TM domain-containing protein [Dyella sp.]|uniref:glycine zipper 2TM domain-containing protein n=1 Tax=Dyella sp. TaxID=1869338 RepID=UPI002ECFFA85